MYEASKNGNQLQLVLESQFQKEMKFNTIGEGGGGWIINENTKVKAPGWVKPTAIQSKAFSAGLWIAEVKLLQIFLMSSISIVTSLSQEP